ncbi:MAG: NADH-quinone oxidoreductase subunit N [Duncaniella sp.]|nr:NADH-quinone oxidoreductase subunit N [Duncaniella sp.]MDE6177579.1 NADH-quinone oxidoreductase subunit N [Duncaniella sp.]
MDYSQFLAMKQEIALLIAFLVVFLCDTFASAKAAKSIPAVACMWMAAVTVFGFITVPDGTETAFAGMYATSKVMYAIKNILNIGTLIVLIQSLKWAGSDFVAIRRGEFYELIMLTLLGMSLMISSRHFLIFIIGLETASLPLCALVAFNKNRYESHEAAVKYVLTAVFSSAILLMGLSYVYGLCGSLYYDNIALSAGSGAGVMLAVGLAFVIAGFGFKISLVPFHLWTADVYQGAPTPVTSYLSVISKGSAAFAFLVVLTQAFGAVYAQAWEWMLYALIILTITVGNLFAMRQTNMKRFLAFSSISQAGYIMLAVVGNTAMGVSALMFYVLVYVFSNLAAFGVIGAIENATGKVDMTDYNGLYSTNPRLSFTMMLAMFSLAGIPPFAGFFSKFFVFTSTLSGSGSAALYVLVLIALINTIISLYYYLLVVKAMFINPSDSPIATFRSALSERAGMWVCVAGIIGLGIASYFYDYLLTIV